ncbi:MAG TPA: hypothetical protein VNJ10_08105 [Sphingomonas sp.]|nr:hypothetical protein [Sphingomonas sp.]
MDADNRAWERRRGCGGHRTGEEQHRLARHPVVLGIINRSEGVTVSLLFAQVRAHRLGVTVLREYAISTGSFCNAVNPIAAVALG